MSNVVSEGECRDTNNDGDCMNCATVPANWLCPKKAVHPHQVAQAHRCRRQRHPRTGQIDYVQRALCKRCFGDGL